MFITSQTISQFSHNCFLSIDSLIRGQASELDIPRLINQVDLHANSSQSSIGNSSKDPKSHRRKVPSTTKCIKSPTQQEYKKPLVLEQ